MVGGRPVRSKKSTSNGSVSVAAYISQSCRSRPRAKRNITSLICWRSQSWRTISSTPSTGGLAVTDESLLSFCFWLDEHVRRGGQEQGADFVVELAVGSQPPDGVGDRDAAHSGQRDVAAVLGRD